MKSSTDGKEYPKKEIKEAAEKYRHPVYNGELAFIEGGKLGYTLGRKEQREEDLKESRELLLKLRRYRSLRIHKHESMSPKAYWAEIDKLNECFDKALAAFTEEEQKSLTI